MATLGSEAHPSIRRDVFLRSKNSTDANLQHAINHLREINMEWDGQDEYDPSTPINKFSKGQNFWAYSGEGRPTSGDSRDLYLGDPAHEHQGWYGIYDKDTDMINFFKKMGKNYSTLN
ncbi:hypothetical protein H8356DRAFT_1402564 [Neocallimastix lanati (nom. inval.)]|nr:hypothetical protein H8356DRAFT_1402564 [Neocallimastix sp. JGI-2020a]